MHAVDDLTDAYFTCPQDKGSNQTELFQELESIYKLNNEWQKEQEARQQLIRQMANEYQDVTSNDSKMDSQLSF